jgi:hypothetical protein
VEEFGLCPVFASFTPAFALQLWKKYGKTPSFVWKIDLGFEMCAGAGFVL